MEEDLSLDASSPVATEAAGMARALIAALASDDGEMYGSLLTEAIGRGFNGLEILASNEDSDMPERIAWVTALVASLVNACCISIGVAEAAGLSAPEGESLLSEILTALSLSRVTF